MSISEERELEEMGLQRMSEQTKISRAVDVCNKAVPSTR